MTANKEKQATSKPVYAEDYPEVDFLVDGLRNEAIGVFSRRHHLLSLLADAGISTFLDSNAWRQIEAALAKPDHLTEVVKEIFEKLLPSGSDHLKQAFVGWAMKKGLHLPISGSFKQYFAPYIVNEYARRHYETSEHRLRTGHCFAKPFHLPPYHLSARKLSNMLYCDMFGHVFPSHLPPLSRFWGRPEPLLVGDIYVIDIYGHPRPITQHIPPLTKMPKSKRRIIEPESIIARSEGVRTVSYRHKYHPHQAAGVVPLPNIRRGLVMPISQKRPIPSTFFGSHGQCMVAEYESGAEFEEWLDRIEINIYYVEREVRKLFEFGAIRTEEWFVVSQLGYAVEWHSGVSVDPTHYRPQFATSKAVNAYGKPTQTGSVEYPIFARRVCIVPGRRSEDQLEGKAALEHAKLKLDSSNPDLRFISQLELPTKKDARDPLPPMASQRPFYYNTRTPVPGRPVDGDLLLHVAQNLISKLIPDMRYVRVSDIDVNQICERALVLSDFEYFDGYHHSLKLSFDVFERPVVGAASGKIGPMSFFGGTLIGIPGADRLPERLPPKVFPFAPPDAPRHQGKDVEGATFLERCSVPVRLIDPAALIGTRRDTRCWLTRWLTSL